MATQRARMSRPLRGATNRAATLAERVDAPRRVRRTVIDFSSLALPPDVKLALADAVWNHFGARSPQQILTAWTYVRVFIRFTGSCASLQSVVDIDQGLLVRYIEWLNAQSRANGEPWTKSSRSSAYTTLRMLLQWLVRCRPGVLGDLHFPFNPFPW